jgi:hypothetical protein
LTWIWFRPPFHLDCEYGDRHRLGAWKNYENAKREGKWHTTFTAIKRILCIKSVSRLCRMKACHEKIGGSEIGREMSLGGMSWEESLPRRNVLGGISWEYCPGRKRAVGGLPWRENGLGEMALENWSRRNGLGESAPGAILAWACWGPFGCLGSFSCPGTSNRPITAKPKVQLQLCPSLM